LILRAKLALADGRVFSGESFGATGEIIGEVVFNTSMTGYQEILTDPSYCGQLVTMTYPLIGNYGATDEDMEASRPYADALIVREKSRVRSNFRSQETLDEFMGRHGVIGIEGLDTRALVRHLVNEGAMMGVLSTNDIDDASLVAKAAAAPGMAGRDLAQVVTCTEPYGWQRAFESEFDLPLERRSDRKYKVVAMDFGVKRNILRWLVAAGCDVTVVPARTPAEDLLAMTPDGVFLSNGPGDPEPCTYAIECVRKLLGKVPVFGICLGHQIMGLAMGGKTYKLKFGHRGGNQPVMDLSTRKVEITSQNHGFAVDIDSLAGRDVSLTHINLNDQTCEGLAHDSLPAFSVQYHPEASPGPHDSGYLFDRFAEMMEGE